MLVTILLWFLGTGVALYMFGAILMLWRWFAPNGALDKRIDAIGVHSGPDSENELRAKKAHEVWDELCHLFDSSIFCMGRASGLLRERLAGMLGEFYYLVEETGESNNTFDNLQVLYEKVSPLRLCNLALVSSAYHRFRVEQAGKRVGLNVFFQKAPSRSIPHILLEPVAIVADILPIRNWVYKIVRRVRRSKLP